MEIEFKDAQIGYQNIPILKNINLLFNSGHFYCILGANGIGKTTLFKSMLGFIPIQHGQLLIDKHKIDTISSKKMAEYLSYVPQSKDNAYDMKVYEVVIMGRSRFIKKFSQPSEKDYKEVNKVLRLLNIERLANKRYTELSGGEQQIVLIARALVQESKFIIMDEPASNLDFENQQKVLECLNQLSKSGLGVILTSHSPDHAIYCNAEVIMIDKGKNITCGKIEDVLNNNILKDVYGVDIQLITGVASDGKIIKSCCLINKEVKENLNEGNF